MDKKAILRWGKRVFVYLLGLFCMAVGVVLSSKSALGVSPVTCLANVVYQIALAEKAPWAALGTCTTAVFCLYILVQVILLRRKFRPAMLLQIIASFVFGFMVTLATAVFSFLPAPEAYPLRLLYLLVSIPLVALGIMLYLAPDLLAIPGEGVSMAVSRQTGLPLATCKTVFDCVMVVVSALVSLLYFGGLVGVREGTVLSALLVGLVLRRLQRQFQPGLLRLLERLSKVERLAQLAVPLDRAGKPKIMVTVGRQFGSGGHEIARKLARELGVTFYDEQLIPLEAAESGLSEEYIRNQERQLRHEVVYDFLTANYAMTNDDLDPVERLFAARSRVIRRIAASDESCVIVGRCADYILKDDPNSFSIFVHADPEDRVRRIAHNYGAESRARRDMEATDRARARLYRQCTGRDYGDGRYFDLSLDSGRLGIEGSVELVMNAVRLWCDVRGVEPFDKSAES